MKKTKPTLAPNIRNRHPAVSRKAFHRLTAIMEEMAKRPDQVKMEAVLTGEGFNAKRPGGCGTAGCIYGFGFALFDRRVKGAPADKLLKAAEEKFQSADSDVDFYWGSDAPRILGVEDHQVNTLCLVDNWPETFKQWYEGAKTPEESTAATIARIRYFLATGE